MRNSILYTVLLLLLVSSWARPYRKINMASVPFKDFREDDRISYSVRQGVLYNMKDYFFARRELKKDMSLVAVKIINKSDSVININDLDFTCGAILPVSRIGVHEYYNAIKQKPGLYWLYAAGVAIYPKPAVYTDAAGVQQPKPDNSKKLIKNGKQLIPLPFGLPVAAANYGISYKANKKMLLDFQLLDLSNRVIQPHDSIQGILTFKNIANCGDIFIHVKQ